MKSKHLTLSAIFLAVAAFTGQASATTSGNLIVNGDGESGKCGTEWDQATYTLPGWTMIAGNPTAQCYTITSVGTPNSAAQGNAFLADGPYGDSQAYQTVSVASASTAIDTGSVTYNLSGWLGGYTSYTGEATVSLNFLDVNGNKLGTGQIGPVTPSMRSSSTKLIAESKTGTVPVGTRSIQTVLLFDKTNGSQNVGYADNLSLTLSTPVTAPVLTPPVSTVPQYDHVFVIYMENTDATEVIGNTSYAPYFNSLLAQGSLLNNYTGVYHPSDENYLALAGGDTYVKGGTYYPNVNDPNQHIGDVLESVGKTWKSYEQGMGTPCNMTNSNDKYFYADDAPFANYTNISGNLTRCKAHLVDISQLTTDLASAATTPNFAWIAADDYNNGEWAYNDSLSINTSIQVQDKWLSQTLPLLFNSPAWTQGRSLLILTWDESSTGSWVDGTYNQVAAVVLGSPGTVKAGYTSQVRYNHYSSLRTVESALGLGSITLNDQYAAPINDVFQ